MSITDELREWAHGFNGPWRRNEEMLLAIADRIDAATVELPKDADGEYIHIGDVMEFTYDPPQDQPLFEVSGIGADGTLFYAPRGEVFPRKSTKASVVRHHHAPTVEDVLREACKAYHALLIMGMSDATHDMPAPSEIIAEYAAKLQELGIEVSDG